MPTQMLLPQRSKNLSSKPKTAPSGDHCARSLSAESLSQPATTYQKLWAQFFARRPSAMTAATSHHKAASRKACIDASATPNIITSARQSFATASVPCCATMNASACHATARTT